MEQYVGNTFWASDHSRTVPQDFSEMKNAGITVIRLPVVHQGLSGTDPQGMNFLKNYSGIINDPTYPMTNSRQALESMLKAAAAAGVYVMLDIHSCSNYVDWRKGRFDARPPYVDANRILYDYTREDSSCASTNNPASVTRIQAYNSSIWIQDLQVLAGMNKQLGLDVVLGIDLFNEPWDYSWSEWKSFVEQGYAAINAVDPNLLVFVQGVSASHGNQLGPGSTPVAEPHGVVNPNWGENLYSAGGSPPNIPKSQLVFMPHAYGPSVSVQPQFLDPTQTQCAGLQEQAAAQAKCNIVINPTLLKQGWEEHFGYLKDQGYAVMVGEWGGNLDWPGGKASQRDKQLWGFLPVQSPGVDEQWQNAFTDYLVSRGIESCYWSINPESGDTYGWYTTSYDPVSNTGGWGTWGAFDTRRTALLNKVWSGIQ
jgi:aryl-phospho-beta-D-glucosidase BglC (GH1 family)